MTDNRKKTFTAAKLNWLDCVANDRDLKPAAFKVAYAIMQHVNSETLVAWISDETLVDITGISRAQVQRHRESLKAAGWLTWERTQDANHYTPIFEGVNAGLDDILARRAQRKERRQTRRRGVGGTPDASPAMQPDASPAMQPDASPARHIHLRSNTYDLTPKEDNIPRAACAAEPSDRDHCSPPDEERCPRTYRQSPAEAARAWSELRRLDGWAGVWGDDEMAHWHALLRKGHAADDIVDLALNFLRETPEPDVPSLGDFLACFESYLEDKADDASSLPPMQHATATDHHHAHA